MRPLHAVYKYFKPIVINTWIPNLYLTWHVKRMALVLYWNFDNFFPCHDS